MNGSLHAVQGGGCLFKSRDDSESNGPVNDTRVLVTRVSNAHHSPRQHLQEALQHVEHLDWQALKDLN
jgi:hypothetical protein